MFNMIPFIDNGFNLFRYFDQMEQDFWNNSLSNAKQFRCDVQDKGDSFVMEAELPGFERENISIGLGGTTLTVSAHNDTKTDNTAEGYVCRERKIGAFSRSFDVSGIDAEKIQAAYHNGILTLTLPKKNRQLPEARQIAIEGE